MVRSLAGHGSSVAPPQFDANQRSRSIESPEHAEPSSSGGLDKDRFAETEQAAACSESAAVATVDRIAGTPVEAAAEHNVDTPPSPPPIPNADWVSPSFRAWRMWLLIGGSAALGAALAAGTLHVLWNPGRSRHQDAMASAEQPVGPSASAPVSRVPSAGSDDKHEGSPATLHGGPTSLSEGETRPSAVSGSGETGTVTEESIPEVAPETGPPPNRGDQHPAQSNEGSDITADIRYKLAAPPSQPIDVSARLADPISALRLESMPLIDFLRLVSQLSNVPIALEPQALQMAGLRAAEPVSLDSRNGTVGEVLVAGLRPLRLGYQTVEGCLVVRSMYSLDQQLRPWGHSVSDLVGSDPEKLAVLVQQIHNVVAPQSWQRHGGTGSIAGQADGKLRVIQTADVHYQLHMFCERLRVARGMPPSRRHGVGVQLSPRAAPPQWERLERIVSVDFEQSAPLIDIVKHLERSADSHILIDWPALLMSGWTLQSESSLVVRNVSLDEALDSLLRPIGLTYHMLDNTTLEITSPAALLSRTQLEFYDVGDLIGDGPRFLTSQQLFAAVHETVGSEHFPSDTGLGFDPESNCLMVLLPPPQQETVAETLALLRSNR